MRPTSDRSSLAEKFATDKPDGDEPADRRTDRHRCVRGQLQHSTSLLELSRPANYPCMSGTYPEVLAALPIRMHESQRRQEEWEASYRAGRTACDRGAVSPALEHWLAGGDHTPHP